MTSLLCIHRANNHSRVWVNPDHIALLEADGAERCRIEMSSGTVIIADISLTQIKANIASAQQ